MNEYEFSKLFPLFPEREYLVWDGRRREGERLYLEEPWEYGQYTGPDFDLLGIKVSGRVLYHKRLRDTTYAIKCLAEDISRARNRHGKDVILFQSGAIPTGRKIRLRRGERILGDYIREKQKDSVTGQPILFGMISEALNSHGIDCKQYLVTHSDFDDIVRSKELSEEWANLLDDGYVVCVNEDDVISYTEIEQEIMLTDEGIVSLDHLDPAVIKSMENDIRAMKIFSDNDGLQRIGCQAMAGLGMRTAGINLTTDRGIRPLDYYTGGPFAKYKVISIVKDPTGLESQIMIQEDMKERSRGGGLSKIKNCGEAVTIGNVEQVIVTQSNYPQFDRPYQKELRNSDESQGGSRNGGSVREEMEIDMAHKELLRIISDHDDGMTDAATPAKRKRYRRHFRPIDAFMEGRFMGTRFVGEK